jgi:hypothetical protein
VGWALHFPTRFRSQAFSTSQRFPGKLEFHGLVSCRNRSWVSFPSELSPHSDRVPLSRPLAPPQLSTAVPGRRSSAIVHHPFHRLPRTGRSRLIPRPAMGSLSTSRSTRFPVPLDRSGTRSFPTASPTSKLCSPCESVRSVPANRERRPLLSWSLALLKTLPKARSLYPSWTRPRARPQHAPAPEGSGLTTTGTFDPRVGCPPLRDPRAPLRRPRQLPDSFEPGLRHLLGDVSSSQDLLCNRLLQLAFGVSKSLRSDTSPKRSVRLLQGPLPPHRSHGCRA